jgi:plasmid stabilization system protein ParE
VPKPTESVAERVVRVELTPSFLERLQSIETFLTDAQAPQAYDALLADLRGTVIPNVARFPRIGRRYLDRPPQSVEALAQLAGLPAGSPEAVREYLIGDCLILYALADRQGVVYLLSIRHHRQLSFDFARLWPT